MSTAPMTETAGSPTTRVMKLRRARGPADRGRLWGAAFGGAPTLLQTALVDISHPANADVATSLQATVHNVGIVAGSPAGGVVLESSGAGAGALPWTALPLVAAALATVSAVRGHAFPATRRPTQRTGPAGARARAPSVRDPAQAHYRFGRFADRFGFAHIRPDVFGHALRSGRPGDPAQSYTRAGCCLLVSIRWTAGSIPAVRRSLGPRFGAV
ncbi:hypothetical protein ACFWDI_02885 [Streptomyces sp. NPDC060064]|uniref:hypothetical protein n=1 Tax=Streptomyces sp. NPDC060064 TaxID=3347049 RepID=UPI00367F6F8F